MGYIVPPLPLTREQFHKAWREGKRTMAEIDPEFYKWQQGTAMYLLFGKIVLVLGIIAISIIISFIIK